VRRASAAAYGENLAHSRLGSFDSDGANRAARACVWRLRYAV